MRATLEKLLLEADLAITVDSCEPTVDNTWDVKYHVLGQSRPFSVGVREGEVNLPTLIAYLKHRHTGSTLANYVKTRMCFELPQATDVCVLREGNLMRLRLCMKKPVYASEFTATLRVVDEVPDIVTKMLLLILA
jgi:hypothetical protein